MWAVQYHRHGGSDQLQLEEVCEPVLRRGQALIRVSSSCISRIDAEYLAGRIPHGFGFPKRVGLDAIGQVQHANGTGLLEGSWVAVVLGLEPWTRRGTTVETLAVEPNRCGTFPPAYVPSKKDCALVLGGLTALKAVRDALKVQDGERVLVVGAGGPVGLAAIQIARLHGASVDAVAGSRALDTCVGLGADRVWDYNGAISELQSGREYDGLVLAAGRSSNWTGALRRGGRMALTDGTAWPASIPGAIRSRVRSIPVAAGHASHDLTWLAERISTGDLVAVVDSWFEPSDIHGAIDSLTSPGTLGARLIEHPDSR